jgi:RNA polymerase sigma factor (sigma-70 family)
LPDAWFARPAGGGLVVAARRDEDVRMGRDDADFAAYMAARWPFVVRSLMLMGCSQQEAERTAQTGLARCYGSWDRVRKADDVDAHVYRAVLECWHGSRRRRRAAAPAEAPADVPSRLPADRTEQASDRASHSASDEEVSDAVLLRHALEKELARLAPEDREPLVLRFVADLAVQQVAEVLDIPVSAVRSRVSQALSQVDLAALREIGAR